MKKFKKLLIYSFQIVLFITTIDCILKDANNYFIPGLILIFIFVFVNNMYVKKYGDNSSINYDVNIPSPTRDCEYFSKSFLSKSEYSFYKKIESLNDKYIVVPQVNLGSLIYKTGSKYRNELFKLIDFGIFDKEFNLLLLIELNDSSHNNVNRKDRDQRVKKILNDCNIKLITFYTSYPNEKDYVINRILKNIENKNIEN